MDEGGQLDLLVNVTPRTVCACVCARGHVCVRV